VIRWRNIKTAPTDGTRIILGLTTAAGKWVGEGYCDPDGNGWFVANTHHTDATDGSISPTHWQPLPEPPK
jgi:hypothetical protein